MLASSLANLTNITSSLALTNSLTNSRALDSNIYKGTIPLGVGPRPMAPLAGGKYTRERHRRGAAPPMAPPTTSSGQFYQ